MFCGSQLSGNSRGDKQVKCNGASQDLLRPIYVLNILKHSENIHFICDPWIRQAYCRKDMWYPLIMFARWLRKTQMCSSN